MAQPESKNDEAYFIDPSTMRANYGAIRCGANKRCGNSLLNFFDFDLACMLPIRTRLVHIPGRAIRV